MNREPCPHCTYNDWREVRVFKQVNPKGEYVGGYGHTPVLKQSGSDWICNACGWKEGGNPAVIILDNYGK